MENSIHAKEYYRQSIWEEIVSHPDFDVGRRELESLIRFLPSVSQLIDTPTNIIHLGIGNGREIPHFIANVPSKIYIINDIDPDNLNHISISVKHDFPSVQFQESRVDIEKEGAMTPIRENIDGPVLWALVGNGSIFSNYLLDDYISNAMQEHDTLLVTFEVPHENMFQSYQIEPVMRFLSYSGADLTTITYKYDRANQCLKINSGSKTIFASYKPTAKQLEKRLHCAGLQRIAISTYPDIHMVAGLFRRN